MYHIFHPLYLQVHKTVYNAFFNVFRLSNPVAFKKSYLSTYLGYPHNSFSIRKLMTCSQIITYEITAMNYAVLPTAYILVSACCESLPTD